MRPPSRTWHLSHSRYKSSIMTHSRIPLDAYRPTRVYKQVYSRVHIYTHPVRPLPEAPASSTSPSITLTPCKQTLLTHTAVDVGGLEAEDLVLQLADRASLGVAQGLGGFLHGADHGRGTAEEDLHIGGGGGQALLFSGQRGSIKWVAMHIP